MNEETEKLPSPAPGEFLARAGSFNPAVAFDLDSAIMSCSGAASASGEVMLYEEWGALTALVGDGNAAGGMRFTAGERLPPPPLKAVTICLTAPGRRRIVTAF